MGVLVYLARAFGLMTVSGKLGVKNGWLGFIPFADCWLLGRLAQESDAQLKPDEKRRPWGKIYLWLSILNRAAAFILIVLFFVLFFLFFSDIGAGISNSFREFINGAGIGDVFEEFFLPISENLTHLTSLAFVIFFGCIALVFLLAIASGVLGVAEVFVRLYAEYKVYDLLAGKHAVWMVILSAFVSFAQPVLLLILGLSSAFMPKTSEQRWSNERFKPVQTVSNEAKDADTEETACKSAEDGAFPSDGAQSRGEEEK